MTSILIIEDEPQICTTLRVFLDLHNFQVLTAGNGQQGVTMARAHLPDLIICDIMMPELDGYGVRKKLAEDIRTDAIPFIFLTAKASLDDLRQGMNVGADDYITKPFKFEDVLTSIETRLKRKQALALPYQQELQKLDGLLQPSHQTHVTSSTLSQLDIKQQFDRQVQTLKSAQKSVIPLILFTIGQYLEISSSYGHATAHCLLAAVIERFQQYFQTQSTKVTMTPLGSHHLAILLPSTDQVDGIDNIVLSLLENLEDNFYCNQQSIKLQGYFGIALATKDGEDWDFLLNNAEIALQHAQQKKQRYQYYDPSLQSQLSRRYHIENLLHEAVKQQEFELYFQPQISIEKHRIVGAEALIRWPNSALGAISPIEFIPIAEASGSIHEIGAWVLYTACKQAQTWRLEGFPDLRIAVNISSIQLANSQLVEQIQAVLTETHLPPQCLELELTESAFVKYPEETRKIMEQLKEMGIHLSIDDFGTGYASLSYLQSFPFDTLKIDRCFIRKITQDIDSLAIVETITKLARKLKLDVVAEGVEQVEELKILQKYGCDTVQGYLFSAPCSTDKFYQLLQGFSFSQYLN
ncbi:MAG: EAL domain-containing protein [Leptolyngbya sp. SIO3F4]|nr:EAL domain-containing protein [Leptolyngbya sp. SIO3F4]